MNRRGFLGRLLGAVGLAAAPLPALAKAVAPSSGLSALMTASSEAIKRVEWKCYSSAVILNDQWIGKVESVRFIKSGTFP